MRTLAQDYGMTHICLWDTLEYDGLCTHSCLNEVILRDYYFETQTCGLRRRVSDVNGTNSSQPPLHLHAAVKTQIAVKDHLQSMTEQGR